MIKSRNIIPLTALILGSCSSYQKEQEQPNILYVFPDQFRNSAMSFWNEPEFSAYQNWKADPVYTPNLNDFAKESVVLSRATSSCPLSSPYRGMFLTGMYPQDNGIYSNCMAERPTNTLNTKAICISDILSNQGYSCGYIGKFHAEVPMKNDPSNIGHYVSDRRPEWDAYTPAERRHGFDYWYSYGTFDEHKNPHYWDTDGIKHSPKEFSLKHEVDNAIKYLENKNNERKEGKPFFLTIAFNPPHSPYEDKNSCMIEDYNRYKGLSNKELFVRDNADTTLTKIKAAPYYFANITAVDREFGRLLKALKDLGLDKNTIVVFTSDHGETMCSHSTYDPKNSIWTESFNVPFILRYPQKLKARVDTTLLATTDIMPTLLSLAGFVDKIPSKVKGRDLSFAFEGKENAQRPKSALYMRNINGSKDEDGLVKDFFPVARGLKTDKYTFEIALKRDTTLKSIQIYNDIDDPYQLNNLYRGLNEDLTKQLISQLQEELKRTDDIWFKKQIIDRFINIK